MKVCFLSESGYGSSGHPGSGGPTGSDQGQSPGDRRSRLRKSHSSGGDEDDDANDDNANDVDDDGDIVDVDVDGEREEDTVSFKKAVQNLCS